MKATTDSERLAGLQVSLQEMIAKGADEKLTTNEREAARMGAVDLATQICEIAKQGDAPVYIINITKKRWLCSRTYASYWIHGREDGQKYAATVIAPATGWRDAGFGGEPFSVRGVGDGWRPKGAPLYYRAQVVANDLCREINGDLPNFQSGDVSEANSQGARLRKTMGVFVSPTRIPSPELLAKETAALNAYSNALVMEGQLIWEQKHDYRMIGALHHEAARQLMVETDWHQDYMSRVTCAGCGERVRGNVAKCPKCGWIINEQAVREQAALAAQINSESHPQNQKRAIR